jgi:uncharacterized protein (DUF952 family)
MVKKAFPTWLWRALVAPSMRLELVPAFQDFRAARLTPVTPIHIYRIVAEDVWQRAAAAGTFAGTEHDVRDGFIHFSTASQVAETAVRHYAGLANLLLVTVNVATLGDALRWEPSRGGALFPHLYATLPTSAATRVVPLPLGSDGVHVLPPLE